MAVPDSKVTGAVLPGRRGDLQPGGQVTGGNAPEYRVHEARRSRPGHVLDQVYGGGDGRVRADPGSQQLVRAEPQRLAHDCVERVEAAVAADGQDRVISAQAAQRAIAELSGQRRIPAG